MNLVSVSGCPELALHDALYADLEFPKPRNNPLVTSPQYPGARADSRQYTVPPIVQTYSIYGNDDECFTHNVLDHFK